MRLPAGSFNVCHESEKASSAQYEFTVDYTKIEPISVDAPGGGDLGPMRYLSFDIEAKRKKPGFCKAEEDPCVLICAALHQVTFT